MMDMALLLQDLRARMVKKDIKALVITHNDAHVSEYIAEHDERLAFVSRFTGSAGTALITLDRALLWTDGRYFAQAAKELPEGWELMKSGEKDVPTMEEFLAKLAKGSGQAEGPSEIAEENGSAKRPRALFPVGIDAETTPIKLAERLQAADENLDLVLLIPSLIDETWEATGTRPKPKLAPVVMLPETATGKGTKDKIAQAVSQMKAKKCDTMIVSALDDVAWTLNARGSEIPFNPVFFAHLIIKADGSFTVYTDKRRDFGDLHEYFHVKPYGQFTRDLPQIFQGPGKIWVDPNSTTCAFLVGCTVGRKASSFKSVYEHVKVKLHLSTTSIKLEKPKKTPQEIEAMKKAQISDGAAVSKFLAFLSTLDVDNTDHDEVSLADLLENFRRSQDPAYAGNSFDTISSFKENGAVVHYKPKRGDCMKIEGNGVFLCDSGGHYSYGGTTDTTRTVWLGKRVGNDYQDATRCYTYVLKAHVALAMTVFPNGILPSRLDSIPRAELWKAHLDYKHGTGHGVGCWLCVHELPPLISLSDVGLGGISANMCVTNEPGYYEEGRFGFRIENLMFVEETSSGSGYCRFSTITVVPYCRELTDASLLTDAEKTWLNNYHAWCKSLLEPLLKEDRTAIKWLHEQTAPFK